MKRKNLEKAIILGLLAASISVPVWAADQTSGPLWGEGWNGEKIVDNGDNLIVNAVSDEGVGVGIGPKGTVNVINGDLTVNARTNGIQASDGVNATVNIFANNINITAGKNGIFTWRGDVDEYTGHVLIGSKDRRINSLCIEADGQGIDAKKGWVKIYGTTDSIIGITSTGTEGYDHAKPNGGTDYLTDDQAAIGNGHSSGTTGETVIEGGTVSLRAERGSGIINQTEGSSTTIKAENSVTIVSDNIEYNDVLKNIDNAGINNKVGNTTITAKTGGIEITSSKYGIVAQDGVVNLTSYTGNKVNAAIENITLTNEDGEKVTQSYGRKHSIKAEDGSDVNMIATDGNNNLYGVIYAKDYGSVVNVSHDIKDDNGKVTLAGRGSNYIYSSAHGSTDGVSDRSSVVAALYAQNQGQIDIVAGEGGINHIETLYSDMDEYKDSSERTIWAQRGGKVNIEGQTYILASNSGEYTDGIKGNARGIAITAGTGEKLEQFRDPATGALAYIEVENRSTVNLDYKNSGDGILHSFIKGDLVSGYGGLIQVNSVKGSGLDMMGNALAANGGILELDLGTGGTWYGRADDYGDAGYGNDAKNHENFYNPAFSNEIIEGGTVNVAMGEGSKWYLTGQSWVSSLDISGANGNAVINMAYDGDTHGLTIGSLNGIADGKSDATFIMALNHDNHEESDMLYVKNATGEYDVVINDMIDGIENINENNVLRFATVKGGATFENVTMKDTGIYNLEFEVDHSEYNENNTEENSGYNGEQVGTNKPGNGNVEDFFDLNKDSEDNTQKIMLMDNADAAADPDSVQNWYITKVLGEDISDGGKTVVNMSKVNYSNAVYMDRLNKRLGEARYINTEEDQGMWVRMRHDRIGKDNEFRIMNTMYELGYDEKQECDNGERRVGAAIDYMDGSSEYTGVGGSGDVSRKGIWLYDTWLGDKGHYSDFVAKWGHLSNDFTLYRGGDKITGDFSNNVYSISAEYGRKKDIGNNWYFEPQVQLQYARVTDANYTTSQGTEVSLDAINSLIARAGFRLGKDLGERSTVYFKADLLHEFLGDQDIYATDGTGTMDVTYGNEGTWCDIGFGFATAMSKTSYAYLDVETSLGNDYEETYQINAGLQWSF